MGSVTFYIQICLIITSIKLMLIPAYRSTDFEVHRNWLAITHSLPIREWYQDERSIWTLDYPPLFAWFEWALSHIAKYFDPDMLVPTNLEYASSNTILFQRLSVITSDLVLLSAAYALSRRPGSPQSNAPLRGPTLFFLVTCAAGLLIVDHIHFQYNGFLLGVLLWSIFFLERGASNAWLDSNPNPESQESSSRGIEIRNRVVRDFLLGSVAFAVLLNLKHLFVFAGPAFFVFILRRFCFLAKPSLATASSSPIDGNSPLSSSFHSSSFHSSSSLPSSSRPSSSRPSSSPPSPSFSFARFAGVGGAVVAVFVLSLAPFGLEGQLPALLARLFPFGRGLCHAYWAANGWAIYSAADKVAAATLLRGRRQRASMTGGVVGVQTFAVLPNVSAPISLLLSILAMLPCLLSLFLSPVSSVATSSSSSSS
eukprot:CAMPEP_0175077136 /NCGR_PEP_ID=MMETSP0052_2-20121109/23193_1 /TAXON_ID=51329 ORGANISM="Polytomella parva, Strain SAG 63-3" /NCGR_SAMPLE_ID=MMETSP0052_2 /ASSEMBLY_ACC=CAM_ASM_000194 /LENGTH=424 /DNA_ID=CAMNT_0016346509 /DNA_START=2981 /DNA_END=4252 /DNA_ORIENTATION=+